MSYSAAVKEELVGKIPAARHCMIAELAALYVFLGRLPAGDSRVLFVTEHEKLAAKIAILLRKCFDLPDVGILTTKEKGPYQVAPGSAEDCRRILLALRILDRDGAVTGPGQPVHRILLQKECCRRSFLRGAFLAGGSVSDPQRSYHYEIVCPAKEAADQVVRIIGSLGIEARAIRRKDSCVAYVKESSAIADLIGFMDAGVSMLQFENVRVVKEVRGSVNRRVNCETANIEKTATASARQIEDIQLIRKRLAPDMLAKHLDEIAEVRLQYPEATLKELGAMLDPPVGKSGVNHRLRKLHEIADSLRY